MPSNGNYLVAIGLEGVAEGVERQISEMSETGKKQGVLETVTLNSEKHHAFWIAIRDFSKGLNGSLPEPYLPEVKLFNLQMWRDAGEL